MILQTLPTYTYTFLFYNSSKDAHDKINEEKKTENSLKIHLPIVPTYLYVPTVEFDNKQNAS